MHRTDRKSGSSMAKKIERNIKEAHRVINQLENLPTKDTPNSGISLNRTFELIGNSSAESFDRPASSFLQMNQLRSRSNTPFKD